MIDPKVEDEKGKSLPMLACMNTYHNVYLESYPNRAILRERTTVQSLRGHRKGSQPKITSILNQHQRVNQELIGEYAKISRGWKASNQQARERTHMS